MSSTAAFGQDQAFLGVSEDPISIQGGVDVRCPTCTRESNPDWSFLEALIKSRDNVARVTGLPRGTKQYEQVALDWMRCANEHCGQLIVRVHDSRPEGYIDGTGAPVMRTDTWIAFPRFGEATREIDPLVPEPFRGDYAEAAAILDISPRMSAVLARRIVGDLLKTYAKKTHWGLTARIRSFIKDGTHPSSLVTNLDHLREIADFGAHTQEAEQQSESGEMETVIIDADRDDAEWTLDLVDRLFDYLIITPAKDKAMKNKWDKNIERTGRQQLRPTGDDQ